MGRPLLLVSTTGGGRQVVVRACGRGLRAGVRPGMTLAHARALLPAAVMVREHRPHRDLAALGALAERMVRFSPRVAVDPPDGLLLDISGCQRLFRGEARLLAGVVNAARRMGFAARGAVAPTFGCAWAVARFGRDERVPPGALREAMAPLPVEALRVSPDTAAALAEVGVERVGHLLALPRESLAPRFGDELLLQLDRALGRALETIEPVRPSPPPAAEREFDGPTTRAEAVQGAARDLVEELCAMLSRLERGARRVELRLERAHDAPVLLEAALSRPSRDAAHLWMLLRPGLERANLGWGVERIGIVASAWGILPHEQMEQWSGEEAQAGALAAALDVLIGRLGAGRVLRAEPVASHLPERAFRRVSAAASPPRATPLAPHESGIPAHDRPSVLLESPEPVRVLALTPDGPVLRVWRGDGKGEELRITASVGPERIAAEWWRRAGATRDYFKVQDHDGRWLWLYRELETARWFLHGVWA